MRRLTVMTIAFCLAAATALATVTFGQVSVGVRKGDWMEYQVTMTGTPPSDHDITWARMEVADVQGEAISLDVQTRFSNGTLLPEEITLNLAKGVLGDDFIIPANLNSGNSFHDAYQGNIVITSLLRRTVVGAERTVISGATAQTSYEWDRQTGILIEATSTFPGFTMTTKASATNMWQPQILGLDANVFYVLLVALIAVLMVAFAVLFWRRKTLTRSR